MSHGKLLALGTALHLKFKFGEGYRLNVTVDAAAQSEALSWLRRKLPGATAKGASEVTATVPLSELHRISDVYEAMEGSEDARRWNLAMVVSMW